MKKENASDMMDIKSQVRELADYRQIDLRPYVPPFTMDEEEMEKALLRLRSRHGKMVPADSIRPDDFVTLRLQGQSGKFNKDSIQLRVGRGLLDRELESQLPGLRPGDQRELSASGERVTVTVREVLRRRLPELTDEAVASWQLEGISTVEALRADITARARAQYVEDMSESLTVFLDEELCRRSTFRLDEDELAQTRQEGHDMARDMLRSAGLDPDSATDDEVRAVTGGRSRAEHFAFLEELMMEGLKGTAVGALLMEREQAPLPTEEDYQKALNECAEGMGLTLEQARQVLTRPRFHRQTAANYLFSKMEAYVKDYLTKEN